MEYCNPSIANIKILLKICDIWLETRACLLKPMLSPPKSSFCKVQFSCINSFCHKTNPPGEYEKLATHLKPFVTHFPLADYY